MADGLTAAHDRGVIHRDLKPANLRITSDGRCKILDFGLAKLRLSAKAGPATETLSEATVMAGTLPYMAPEQVLGGEIDARTDIHAAGTVLYEMAPACPPVTHRIAPNWPTKYCEVARRPLTSSILVFHPNSLASSPNVSNATLKTATNRRRNWPSTSAISNSAPNRLPRRRHTQYVAPRSAKKTPGTRCLTPVATSAGLGLWHFYLTPPTAPPSLLLFLVIAVAVLPFTVSDGDPVKVAFGAGLQAATKLTQLTATALQVVPAPEVLGHVDSADAAQKNSASILFWRAAYTLPAGKCASTSSSSKRTRRQLRANSLTVADDDAFHVEDAVVSAAFEMLGMDTRLAERAEQEPHRTQVAGAYDYYLQGVGYLQNYDRRENVDNAIQVFQRALGLDKNYALAHAGLGEAFLQRYSFTQLASTLQQARDSCRTSKQLDSQLPAAHTCLGDQAVATGNYAEAAREFSLVLQHEPTNDAAYKGLANAYERMGKLQQAESTYKQAIALRPHYWATYNWLGAFYYNQARVHDASEMFRQVVALAPDSIRGYSNLAASLMDEGLYDDALHAAQRSIEIQTSDDAYSNLGSAYFFLQRYDDAISAFQKATEFSPRDPVLWLNLGDGYYWAPGRRKDASAAYQNCAEFASQQLEQNSKDSVKLGILSVCQAMLGRKDNSFDSLNRALRLTPDDPSVLFSAALVHIQFDNRDDALHFLTKCRAAGYSPNSRLPQFPASSFRPQFPKVSQALKPFQQIREENNHGPANKNTPSR
jgi:serine/threonine-protein kinase